MSQRIGEKRKIMFDLSCRKILNKMRAGERGPKQRYTVFRATLNLKQETVCEEWVKHYCNLWKK